MNKFFILLVCLVLHCNAKLNAQNNLEKTPETPLFKRISVGFQVGDLIPHYAFMQAYQEKTVKAITISLENDLNTDWSSNYSGISRGIEFHHTSLGSERILGSASHAVYYFKSNLLKPSKSNEYKSNLNLKLGGGIGILTKKFNLEENHLNAVIGTNLNLAITSEFSYRLKLGKALDLIPFFKFTHYSNASFKKPNLGINLLTGGIYTELKTKSGPSLKQKPSAPSSLKTRWNVFLLSGLNELKGNTGIYPNFSLGANYTQFSRALKIGFFGDFQLSSAYRNADFLGLDQTSSWRSSLGGIIGLQFGKSSLNADVGVYVRNKIPDQKPYFQRIYFEHALKGKTSFRFGIKAHATVAETFELGITKTFRSK